MERTADSTSSTDPVWLPIGRVVGAHGLRGQIRVRYFGDGPDELLRQPRLMLGTRENDPEAIGYDVVRAAPGRSGEVRIGLEGVDGRDDAEALRGRLVLTSPDRLAALPPGEYYGYQFVGCRVETEDGTAIGVVRSIWPTGETDVLVVEGEGGVEHLVPAAREVLREIDVEARRIVVSAIPGLLDTV
jgi:16S rRNA processing protein RimM